ncbi:dacB protein [Clostridium sp. CAG:1193]|nr:dacB protein [Clostridium sp. CAG:1193]
MKKILVILFLMLFPVFTNAVVVTSKSAILMDEDTGRILYSKGIDDKRLIASTTKIMTAVLAIESGMLEDKIIVSDEILKAYGSNVYLSVGEEIYLKDLVYALMLRSGNELALTE